MASSSAGGTSQGNVNSNEDVNLNGSFCYTLDGVWKNVCYFGRTNFQSTMLDDDFVKISVFRFDSIEEVKAFVVPLKFFSKCRNVNEFFFVNEHKMESGDAKFDAVVEGIHMDMLSFIDSGIHQMGEKKPDKVDYWWVFGGGNFKRVFRGVNVGMATILLETVRRFDFPSLMSVGVVSIDATDFPKFVNLHELTDPNVTVNLNSKIHDLARTMEYFIVYGAVDIPDNLQMTSTAKMKRLGVPPAIIGYIDKLKAWNIGKEPIEWLLDSSSLWTTQVIVEWIYGLARHVVDWRRSSRVMIKAIDIELDKKLGFIDWESYLPTTGRTAKVLRNYKEILKEEETRLMRDGKKLTWFKYHNFVKFFRHMLEKYNDPFDDEEEKLEAREICAVLESYFTGVGGGLLSLLREIIELVFCLNKKFTPQIKWKELLSSEFAKIANP